MLTGAQSIYLCNITMSLALRVWKRVSCQSLARLGKGDIRQGRTYLVTVLVLLLFHVLEHYLKYTIVMS
jgi:hypothetical protein